MQWTKNKKWLTPPTVYSLSPGAERKSKMVMANWERGQHSACTTLGDNDIKTKYRRFVYRDNWAL